MNTENIKPFTEMSARELFLVLTGEKGIIEQMNLQKILREYVEKYGNTADLVTMVHKVAEDES
jgi:hypothetical protein